MSNTHLYVSKHGGTIDLMRSNNGWLYRVCSERICLYSNDLSYAKSQLDILERQFPSRKVDIQQVSNRYSDGETLQ